MSILSTPTTELLIVHSKNINAPLSPGFYIETPRGEYHGPFTSRRDAELTSIRLTQGRCYVC